MIKKKKPLYEQTVAGIDELHKMYVKVTFKVGLIVPINGSSCVT